MEFIHMPKELNGLSDRALDGLSEWGLSNWFPNGEEFLQRCGHDDHVVKKAWEGQGPTEHKCDLAWGITRTQG